MMGDFRDVRLRSFTIGCAHLLAILWRSVERVARGGLAPQSTNKSVKPRLLEGPVCASLQTVRSQSRNSGTDQPPFRPPRVVGAPCLAAFVTGCLAGDPHKAVGGSRCPGVGCAARRVCIEHAARSVVD